MAHFTDLSDAADDLIRDNGQVVAIRRRSITVTDSAKAWEEGTQTVADTTTEAVLLDIIDSYVDGSSVRRKSQTALVAGKDLEAVSFVPNLRDRLVQNPGLASEEEWEITNIDTVSPDGQNLLYTMLLTRKEAI